MPRTAAASAPPDQTSIEDLLTDTTPVARAAVDSRALCTELFRWEGYRREMYVDWRGDVRTGIGFVLPDARAALALPWRHKATGFPATAAEVRAAFAQVRAQSAGHAAPAHERASNLVLPPGYAALLVMRRLERELLPELRKLLPRFEDYPLAAQRALVEMAYNLGVAGLRRFRNLIASCNGGDFGAAANHCHRRTIGVARNAGTKALFRKAANLTIG
jgi:type VI secretion system secreted protein VgrG